MTATEHAERIIHGGSGVRLAVQDHGRPNEEAATVVLVHGYPDDHHVWDLVVPHLVDQHHVVTYDVRGAGGSVAPSRTDGFRVDLLIGDLVAVADTFSPDRPVHVVAHDWGSMQCWSAMTDPTVSHRFASFMSISGPSLDHVSAWMKERRKPGDGRWKQALRQGAASWYVYAFHTPLPALAWKKGLARRWPEMLKRQEAVQIDEHWPGPGVTRDAVQGINLYRANIFQKLRGAGTGSVHTEVPVQLVVALDDPFVSPALLDGMEAIAPDLVRVPVKGGHWLPRSQPDLVASLAKEHIERVERRTVIDD